MSVQEDIMIRVTELRNFLKVRRTTVLLGTMIVFSGVLRGLNLTAIYDSYDEGTYLLAAWLIYKGKVPYRDFFLAHLPAQEYMLAFLFWLNGGPSLFLGRLVGLFFVLGTAIVLYQLTKLLADAKVALLATAIFLFSPWSFLWGSLLFKEPFVTFFTVASCYLLLIAVKNQQQNKAGNANTILIFSAGATMTLAVEFKITAMVVFLAVAIYMFFQEFRRQIVIYSSGFLLPFITVSSYFFLVAGDDFLYYTVFFHLFRPEDSQFSQHVIIFTLYTLSPVILGIGFSLFQVIHDLGDERSADLPLSIFPLYWLSCIVLLFAFSNSVYYWYFYLILPPLAIQASQGFWKSWKVFDSPKRKGLIFQCALILLLVAGMNVNFFIEHYSDYEFEKIYVGDDVALIEELISYIQTKSSLTAKIFTLNPHYAFYSLRQPSLDIVDPYGFLLANNLKEEQETKELSYWDFYSHSRKYSVSELLYMDYAQEQMDAAIEEADIVVIDSQHSWFLPEWTIIHINLTFGTPRIFENEFIRIEVFLKP